MFNHKFQITNVDLYVSNHRLPMFSGPQTTKVYISNRKDQFMQDYPRTPTCDDQGPIHICRPGVIVPQIPFCRDRTTDADVRPGDRNVDPWCWSMKMLQNYQLIIFPCMEIIFPPLVYKLEVRGHFIICVHYVYIDIRGCFGWGFSHP